MQQSQKIHKQGQLFHHLLPAFGCFGAHDPFGQHQPERKCDKSIYQRPEAGWLQDQQNQRRHTDGKHRPACHVEKAAARQVKACLVKQLSVLVCQQGFGNACLQPGGRANAVSDGGSFIVLSAVGRGW
ncbi:hypothetical protein D3C71_1849470 [compost metagenome]